MGPGDLKVNRPIQVAIIGGGCAGITTAFELSSPIHQGRYQVTVYQQGFRLGGKGASGRGPVDRIEEHGLHLWMGFYENAFWMMRECYRELARDPKVCPLAAWTDAFVPDHYCAVADRTPSGEWLYWSVKLKPEPGLPGDPLPAGHRWSVAHYVDRSLSLLRTLLSAVQDRTKRGAAEPPAQAPPRPGPTSDELLGRLSELLKYGELATLTAVIEGVKTLELLLRAMPAFPAGSVLPFYEALASGARRQLEVLIQTDHETRRLWEIIDLVIAAVRGSLRFGLMTDPRGFDAIDDYDCRDWLRLNGASERSLNSAFIRGLYDLAFAYEDGDVQRPRVAAGQALRGTMRGFFTYRGAFFWKMQAGMGDVVFAPLYELLKRRGVKFEFFHRLENVGLSAPSEDGRRHVASLSFDVQAHVEGGEYRPLVDVKGVPSWPSQPDFTQLERGQEMQREGWDYESFWDRRCVAQKRLLVGQGFDLVVLAVSVASVPHVCRELVESDTRWRDMVQHVKTVPTQALQLWFDTDMAELGWREDPVNLSGFVEPFDTWADMSVVAARENWPVQPRAIAYFCSVLPDRPETEQARASYPAERLAEVRQNAIQFMQRDLVELWPRAVNPAGEFRWDLLSDPAQATGVAAPRGAERIDTQYFRVNVNPSDRYVLALPGSLRYRISPLDPTYDNLTVAGDWTDSGFNEGCVEAAVMSGRLAAHALSLEPALEKIVGFDHP